MLSPVHEGNCHLPRWRHLTSPECPARVMTDQGEFVFTFHTLMVLSWLPLTILPPSNWTQLMPPECPSNVRTWHWPPIQARLSLYLSTNT